MTPRASGATIATMAGQASAPFVPYEDYLAGEESSEVKHEWLAGVVYAMSRGTPEHARLAANVTAALRAALKGECTVYSSDAMLYVRETQLSTYADASVTCGPVETHRVVKNGRALGEAITNPKVVVEVLSESTEAYDRGEKFGHYMRMATLDAYILVSQEERRVDMFRRPADGGHWEHRTFSDGGVIAVCGRNVAVDDIYAK